MKVYESRSKLASIKVGAINDESFRSESYWFGDGEGEGWIFGCLLLFVLLFYFVLLIAPIPVKCTHSWRVHSLTSLAA